MNLTRKATHHEFDFEIWYATLSQHTWDSAALLFSPARAQACVNYYQGELQCSSHVRGALGRSLTALLVRSLLTPPRSLHNQARFNGRATVFTAADRDVLRELEASLDREMQSLGSDDGAGFFVRMSNRSPKDGMPLDPSSLRTKLVSMLPESISTADDDAEALFRGASANDAMTAYCGAQLHCLRVTSGREAMCLLLSSERVFVDLNQALECAKDANDVWQTSCILRKWDEGLRHDWEFRCFVYENVLTAVSQYNHYCTFPDVRAAAETGDGRTLRREIVAYWETMRDDVVPASYVMDLCKRCDGTWVLIELNPFLTTTGACLFTWRADHAVLYGEDEVGEEDGGAGRIIPISERPTEDGLPPLRVRQTDMPGLKDLVEACIMPLLRMSGSRECVAFDPGQRGDGPWDAFLELAGEKAAASAAAKATEGSEEGGGCSMC